MTGASCPVTVVGGYLGSGKTTLINRALRDAEGRRLAVLVNEFGELPIDEDLIEAREGGVISIAGGCVCCAFGDDLAGALADLAGRSPPPDHVLVEASGVAMPGSIMATASLAPGVSPACAAVLADAETIRGLARDRYVGDTILRQLDAADLLVMTKLDLVDGEAREAVAAWLREAAPRARLVAAEGGRVPPDVLLGPRPGPGLPERQSHSDALFESAFVPMEEPVDPEAVAAELASDGPGVVRAKGFVEDGSGRTCLVQVAGRRWSVERADTVGAPRPRALGLVCIGLAGQLRLDLVRRAR